MNWSAASRFFFLHFQLLSLFFPPSFFTWYMCVNKEREERKKKHTHPTLVRNHPTNKKLELWRELDAYIYNWKRKYEHSSFWVSQLVSHLRLTPKPEALYPRFPLSSSLFFFLNFSALVVSQFSVHHSCGAFFFCPFLPPLFWSISILQLPGNPSRVRHSRKEPREKTITSFVLVEEAPYFFFFPSVPFFFSYFC